MLHRADVPALAEDFVNRAPVVVRKILVQEQMSREAAIELIGEVVRFLLLCRWSPKRLGPSVRIDMAWHEMLLCTRAYHGWCAEHLGAFVHHSPDEPGEKNPEPFIRTLQLYELHFGELPLKVWGLADRPAVLANCGQCEGVLETGVPNVL